jgi:hypothetical protein
MRIIIAVVISILIAMAILFIAQKNLRGTIVTHTIAKTELLQKGLKFINALARKDGEDIYRMFNPTFQREVSLKKLEGAIDGWYCGYSYREVKIGTVNITGLAGHITSWISFKDCHETKFVYQYWVKSDRGWELVWLSGILNYKDFNYGDWDTTAQHEVMQGMFEQAVSDSGLKALFREFELTRNMVILYHPDRNFTKINLPNQKVLWLTEEEIKSKHHQYGINAFFDFGMIRVMDDIAIGALDIVSINSHKGNQSGITGVRALQNRRRSISMFFKKVGGEWVFAGYGNKW